MTTLERFSRIHVLCLGDVMLDRFVSGAVQRISPESPVPVLSVQDSQIVPGGAGNVARNVAALEGQCTLLGVVGIDSAGKELQAALTSIAGIRPILQQLADRPTTEKVRFVAQGQHMLRADREQSQPLGPEAEDALLASVAQELPSHQVLVLSDYAKGVLTDRVVAESIRMAKKVGIPVIVDPKSSAVRRYAGATVMTPNTKETFEASGIDPTEDGSALAAGQRLVSMAALDAVLVTRAHRGMTLVKRDGGHSHIKAQAREVFDVVGAGDTVVAALALSLGAGHTLEEAAATANIAAGIVVGKHGTATVSQRELLDEMHRQDHEVPRALQNKLMSALEAAEVVHAWRRDGLTVGFTNGCFDILHTGHISILAYAKGQCDRLVVGINSDTSVRRLKGQDRPLNDEQDRATLIAALAVTDAVVIFSEDTPLNLIAQLSPDVLIKGADYTVDRIVGADHVLAHGGRVLTCPLVPDRSTTRMVTRLRQGTKA